MRGGGTPHYTYGVNVARPSIYLVGPMGSGKTAVGRELARALELPFFDSDAEIEKRTGVDIAYIFEREGEDGFRAREHDMIRELTERPGIVLATGGGAVLDERNRAQLAATGTVVYLRTTVDEQLRRTRRSRRRPLLQADDPRAVLEKLAAERGPLYESIADIDIETTGRRVRTVAAAVRKRLGADGAAALQN